MNEEGDKFYIIEDGEAFASKKFSDDAEEEVVVKEYKTGDFFGELALIKNDLRAANVIARVTYKIIKIFKKYLIFTNF
jgi:cAMP-dependent protein kinase regulator